MQEKQTSITLGDIFRVLWKNVILFCIITFSVLVLGVLYTFGVAKPTYKSSASIIVAVETNTTNTVDVDYTNSVRATITVADTIEENTILSPVAKQYNEDAKDGDVVLPTGETVKVTRKSVTASQLKNMISVKNTSNTFKVTITVTDKDPEAARVLATLIQEKVIEEAVDVKANGEKGVFFFAANSISKSGLPQTGKYAAPNKKLYVVVFFLTGIVLAVIVIFIKEFMSTKFKTKAEIENVFDDKIIGVFPDDKSKDNKEDAKEVKLVEPSIRNFEPYNKLLSNIKYSNLESPYKVIILTSTLSDELKSTTAANLAYTIKNNNQKVIIIDLDIRKSTLHKTFNVAKENGIVDYTAGDVKKEDIIKHSESGVDVITAGKEVLNPVAVLETTKIKDLINELREEYDYVILDTPPCLACSDAQIISTYADGIVFSIALNQAKKKDIYESVRSLKNVDAKIIGLSITKADNKKKDSYYYYYENK